MPSPPIIFLASSEASVLNALKEVLARRFGNDSRIVVADGPAAGLSELAALADSGDPVGGGERGARDAGAPRLRRRRR
jgi:hypothetical protein